MRSVVLLVGLSVTGLSGCIDFELEGIKEPEIEGIRDLLVEPGLLDYGTLASNAPVTDVVTLTSVGDLPVTLSTIDVSGSTAYTISWASTELVLEPGESTDVVVTYAPASFDDLGSMVVRSDAVEPNQVVALHGAGLYPAIDITPSSVYFKSEYGETVWAEVWVTSVGTAALDLSDMYVEGAPFTAEGDIPLVLPPGDSTMLTVSYTPEVEGEVALGKIWLTTNTELGYAIVPLEGHQGPTCIGLGEAWDRDLLDAHTLASGVTLQVDNLSADDEVCIDNWYIWLSRESQDMGAGDMDADFGDVYPTGSLGIATEASITFNGGADSGASWWCLEHTQYTQPNASYEFTGARVPEPLLSYMFAEDQDAVWAWEEENAVMIAARRTNYVSMPGGGGTAPVTLRVLNMGSQDGTAEVRETLLAGFTATDFSIAPTRTEAGADGATVYVFDVSLGKRTLTGIYEQTIYEEQEITYTLGVPACRGRQYHAPMETHWDDSVRVERVATANPLVVDCE
ncbi:MAG: choice-of-anchor D domain-containing protein [Pseudomonadota bacterium]|nr:choice-of-anchor D domain-containing protein [Pseudomonadota bacterium]